MKLSDFVIREAVIPDLSARSKEGVIREMVESLRIAGHVGNGEEERVIKAIMKREEQGTTGIGRGVAVPHTKHAGTARLIGNVALSRTGIDFCSLDGEPVHVLFLLVHRPTSRVIICAPWKRFRDTCAMTPSVASCGNRRRGNRSWMCSTKRTKTNWVPRWRWLRNWYDASSG